MDALPFPGSLDIAEVLSHCTLERAGWQAPAWRGEVLRI